MSAPTEAAPVITPYAPTHKLRVVTAASLFDGHDAAINVMRRLLQSSGAEVIHLGHNRSVADIVQAAIQEDAQAVAVSSYQGGHNEYFRYLKDLLTERGAPHIRIFGGGGGVIIPEEIRALEAYGITRIYHPEHGRRMGLQGMISDLLSKCDYNTLALGAPSLAALQEWNHVAIARAISWVEQAVVEPACLPDGWRELLDQAAAKPDPVVIGVTGTGGAGKSSFTDELVLRLRADQPDLRLAVLSVDPTRRRTGGALLGDRIRMNAIGGDQTFMRSMATRDSGGELSRAIGDAIAVVKAAGAGLVIVETSGIGQGNSAVMDVCDLGIYVMTAEYGAPSQLEKIDMLDFAQLVVINKFERLGALDAFRDVRKQVRRNRELWTVADEDLPVFGTIAAQFNDPGITSAYRFLLTLLSERTGREWPTGLADPGSRATPSWRPIVPPEKSRYLGEIADCVRGYHAHVQAQVELARKVEALSIASAELSGAGQAEALERSNWLRGQLTEQSNAILDGWTDQEARYRAENFVYSVRGREIRQPMYHQSLSHLSIPRVAFPRLSGAAERLRFGLRENLPGEFPYTAGVFPLKRLGELPKRMFAGEGGPARTNARFHYLCQDEPVARLSTAFDSVTLYGEDPHPRPDIYGKIGESGVSVPHLDAMKVLFDGFDLCAANTSVSMTINGPAPIVLAMFLNAAIDQHRLANPDQDPAIVQAAALRSVRGTVQADILKEDQAQNTCIFSTEFALRMMGDIQEWFIAQEVRNFYSVSISGYHIAEAGANPISQLAFTLANGFTFVEYYLARGMSIDAFGPNLSFFFSNGLDAEYTVIGRVARRIWAIVMRDRYGASERAQKLKYHIQTSGRSLHSREIQFNDIRTTVQALLAIQDNCNSLHTNAYDEAVTTPTEESVRRAMAIQLILAKEVGLLKNENPLQGSFIADELTDLVEEAVLQEFERIDARGGVLGAMERQYQRSRIQDESMHYEHLKHSGELPLVGINTFEDPQTLAEDWEPAPIELRRSTQAEKDAQVESVRRFQTDHSQESAPALLDLKQVALSGGNLFAELMSTVRVATLGQITHALYDVGGRYRRNL
jgi:methylmalonyl-CoA mutase